MDHTVAILSQSSLLLRHCCNWGAWNLSTRQVCTLRGTSMEYFQSQMFYSVLCMCTLNAVHLLRCVALQCHALSAPSLSMDYYTVMHSAVTIPPLGQANLIHSLSSSGYKYSMRAAAHFHYS